MELAEAALLLTMAGAATTTGATGAAGVGLQKTSIFTQKFIVGDRVRANWKERGKYFPGVIASVESNNCYEVAYDDGDREKRVKARYIRLLEEKGSLTIARPKSSNKASKGGSSNSNLALSSAWANSDGRQGDGSGTAVGDDDYSVEMVGLNGFTVSQLQSQLKGFRRVNLDPLVPPGEELPKDLASQVASSLLNQIKATHVRVTALMKQVRAEYESMPASGDELHEYSRQQELPLAGIKRAMRFDAIEADKGAGGGVGGGSGGGGGAMQGAGSAGTVAGLAAGTAAAAGTGAVAANGGVVSGKLAPSQEALLATAKACEVLVLELALRAWSAKGSHSGSELTGEDVMRALLDTEHFDIFCGLAPPPSIPPSSPVGGGLANLNAAGSPGASGTGSGTSSSKRGADNEGGRPTKKR